jgi:Ca-activated chloride channel homolog
VSFARPWLAWLAPVVFVAIVIAFALGERRRHTLVARLGELPLVRRMMAAASPARRRIKAVLLAAAATLIALAGAGPGIHGHVESRRRGLDLVVALDVSKSMMAADPAPSRLSHARAAILSLLGQLEDDRVAVVVFAGGAIHFPLTEDKDVASKLFTDIGPMDLPPGSDVAEALRLGRCILRPDVGDDLGCGRVGGRGHGGDPLDPPDLRDRPGDGSGSGSGAGRAAPEEERGKAMILFTDGGGDPQRTKDEVIAARDLGIAIFWVGVGSDQGADVPELDSDGHPLPGQWKHDRAGKTVHSTLDRATLSALSTAGGDVHRYLDLPPAVIEADGSRTLDARPIVQALSEIKRGTRLVADDRREDVYHWFLFPAFLLLVIEACIGTRRRMLYPEGRA